MHYIDILQHQHHFKEALHLLEEVKSKKPKDPRPYLTSAVILGSQGQYSKALKDCKQLLFRATGLVSTSCITQMHWHKNKNVQTYTLLKQKYTQSLHNEKDEKLWTLSVLSKMAMDLNKEDEALFFMKEALSLNSKDYYILGLYSDMLLMQKDYEGVIDILKGFDYVDALLVRLSIAQKNLNMPEAKVNIQKLKGHYQALFLRGEKAHLREQAQYELYLQDNKQRAWILAKENISMQQEKSDIDIFMQAGFALNKTQVELDSLLKEVR